MNFVSLNGKIQSADQPALLVSNRSYRFGDGIFETMKWVNGAICLESLHFDRLFASLTLLKYEWPAGFTPAKIREEISQLCKKNNCERLARVRLSVYRGNGGINELDENTGYVIETWPLDLAMNEMNESGLVIGLFPEAAKHADIYANLKSASALIYANAARYAREQKWNDALILNHRGTIADSTIANIFIVKNGQIITPPLSDGCVNGVMRRWLIEKMRDAGNAMGEEPVSAEDLLRADEIFLTNAIRGIRWVKQFENNVYSNKISAKLFERFFLAI